MKINSVTGCKGKGSNSLWQNFINIVKVIQKRCKKNNSLDCLQQCLGRAKCLRPLIQIRRKVYVLFFPVDNWYVDKIECLLVFDVYLNTILNQSVASLTLYFCVRMCVMSMLGSRVSITRPAQRCWCGPRFSFK
jgi:hypothetical protein